MSPGIWKTLSCLNEHAALVQVLVTFVLFLATCGLWWATRKMAVSTKLLADENRKRGEEAKRPRILAKLKPNADSGSFIQLILNNVGLGAALNVSFQLEGDENDFSRHDVLTRGTSKPVGFVSPGESDIYKFGVGHKLFSDPPLKPFSILIECEDVDGKLYENSILLDVKQFKSLVWAGSSVGQRQARALEKIEEHLGKLRG